jgi:hypothetical protein
MGATKIMVIRHAERPDPYRGENYLGVNDLGTETGDTGTKHLVTLGWERAGALVTLFAPPWGPRPPFLTPQFLFASDPTAHADDDSGAAGPSQRPYETLTALSAKLGIAINTTFRKSDYADMVAAAVTCAGAVLIAWQHEDIVGLGQENLTQTRTEGTMGVPQGWPNSREDARYDLVFVFDRPSGKGPITDFKVVAQNLLAGDVAYPFVAAAAPTG